jgi:hypothetical protein
MMSKRLLFVSTVALALLGACGDTMPPVAPPPVAACLTFYLKEETTRDKGVDVYDRDVQAAVRDATVTGLVQAGFSVVNDPSAPHDIVARLSVEPGSRVETGAKVRGKLVLDTASGPIDRVESILPQDQPGYAPAMAAELVDGLFRSSELAGYIRKLRRPE